MKPEVYLPRCCDSAVLQTASALLQAGELRQIRQTVLPSGELILRAKVSDSFHFVDHPCLTVDRTWMAISEYSCDCPDYRRDRGFCVHCAALAMRFGTKTQSAFLADGVAFRPQKDEQDFLEDSVTPGLKDLSYAFTNSADDLYPGVLQPRIPLVRYQQVFGDNARARMIYEADGFWGGSCFGISATSAMLYWHQSGIDISDFNPDVRYPSQLSLSDRSEKLNMSLHAFIEAVHISQYCRPISYHRHIGLQKPDCMAALCTRVKAFQQGEGEPVSMGVWKNPRYEGGHAIFPFRLESISETMDVLHIYDPNWPLVTRYAFFEKNTQGEYVNWRFPMFGQEIYASETGGELSFDPYAVYKKAWDNRGGSSIDSLVSVSSGVTLLDMAGNVLARVTQDGLITSRDDIYQLPITGTKRNPERAEVFLSMPCGSYIVRNEGEQRLFLRSAAYNYSVTVDTAAREALVLVDDESMTAHVVISEPEREYSVEICSVLDRNEKKVKLEGITGAEGINFAQRGGLLFEKGITDETEVCLTIDEEPVSRDRIDQIIRKIRSCEEEQDMNEEYMTNMRPSEKTDDAQP